MGGLVNKPDGKRIRQPAASQQAQSQHNPPVSPHRLTGFAFAPIKTIGGRTTYLRADTLMNRFRGLGI